ncbi:hypothetical protein SPRG_20063 [Saprolegnia parasitica CBS 223.65]|uniref:Fungal lipase-type domain-containing protein n=1 Tax=Saprolegnia parasitica (strain CBS 223.65) TaxID=695850 RepID=A0A067CQY8_SAPPC|nr:hypothetical protein SPRG_20063 [Saprolegnia parasitica CBS 223.65]KDO28956.1 hypothetical protein SPRG_20063 [Saprolegnia parasitica CBS 223.65]|eukprot:XP_012200296.1 hypothetical protein SPRG_20063 [Saprolegnia parasitica CBS 223.65]
MNTCTGGGAFGMFRRQPGCAINNCQCFPVLFQCDATLGDGIGQCVLSNSGWAFMIAVLLINLIVPGVTLLKHAYEDGKVTKQQRANKHNIHNVAHGGEKQLSLQDDVAPADGVIPNSELYISLKKFGKSVPDTAYGLDTTAKIFMETMSKGWIQYVFYSLIAAFVFCLLLLWVPFEMAQTNVVLHPTAVASVNTSSYDLHTAVNTNLPTAIRFVSLEGDFCAASANLLARNGLSTLHVAYDMTFSVDENDILQAFDGAKSLGCNCVDGVCALVPSQSSTIDGLLPLVYFPWYQDISKPFALENKNHSFELNATFTITAPGRMQATTPLRPIPTLSLVAHHSYVEKITDAVDFVVWVLDFVFFGLWFYLNRPATQPKDTHKIPERKVVVFILLTNILSSVPIFYLSNWFSIHATNQTIYLFSHVWTSSATGLWLLGLLFAIDMQRKRVFTFRFVCVKVSVGLVGLVTYIVSFYYAPVYISSIVDFLLAMLAAAVFRGVMVNVRNQLRNQSYIRTRPEQLTARLLYYIGMAVTYIFIAVAIVADPVPRVSTFISRYALMTDLSMQIMLRTCTWVILLVFLPPTYVNPAKAVYYGRERSALPHLTNGAMRDFELAHLKQAVAAQSKTFIGQSYGGSDASAWKAPHAFCIETGVRMYNMATAVYETLDLDVFAQDELSLVTELYDAGTDTYGYVLRGHQRIVVVFRGTASAKNAVTDVKYNLVPTDFAAHNHPEFEKIRVHTGFWAAYNTVRADLQRAVSATLTEMGRDVQLYFTGHSLGGALATLASFDVAYATNLDVVMYNFGSPRVGNHAFAKAYNKLVPNAYRIVNDGDAVVGNPKRVLHAYCSRNLRYKHVGTVILLSSRASGVFVLDPNIVEMAFIAKLRNNGLSHLMSSYQVMLNKGVDWINREELQKLAKEAKLGADSERTPLMYA